MQRTKTKKQIISKIAVIGIAIAVLLLGGITALVPARNAANTSAVAYAEEIDVSDLTVAGYDVAAEYTEDTGHTADELNEIFGESATIVRDFSPNYNFSMNISDSGKEIATGPSIEGRMSLKPDWFTTYGGKLTNVNCFITVGPESGKAMYSGYFKCVKIQPVFLYTDNANDIEVFELTYSGIARPSTGNYYFDSSTYELYGGASHLQVDVDLAANANRFIKEKSLPAESIVGMSVFFTGYSKSTAEGTYGTNPEILGTLDIPLNMVIAQTYYYLPEAPVKDGYTFTGWYTDEACTNKYERTTITADTTLYAGYAINQLTVTFKDGETVVGTQTVDWNDSLTINVEAPMKTGFEFTCWTYDDGSEYNNESITENITLYAQYAPVMVKITFIVDGKEYKTVSVPYGTSFKEAIKEAALSDTNVMSAVVMTSINGEGEENVSDDQNLDELKSDVRAEIALSNATKAKDSVSAWFVSVGNAIAEHFRVYWTYWVVGGASIVVLTLILAIARIIRR